MKTIQLKDLAKAKRIYNDIIELDAEIIRIEKMANEIINDECVLSLNIKLTNITQQAKQKISFDEDGSLMKRRVDIRSYDFFGIPRGIIMVSEDNAQNNNFEFSESDCLKTLQFILNLKACNRHNLIIELGKMGVNVDNLL